MTRQDLKSMDNYTTDELFDILPSDIIIELPGGCKEYPSLMIDMVNMNVSYSTIGGPDEGMYAWLSTSIEGCSSKYIRDAMYRMLVILIDKKYIR